MFPSYSRIDLYKWFKQLLYLIFFDSQAGINYPDYQMVAL